MAGVKQAVKASLVGTEEPAESIQLSQQVKMNFTQYAHKDDETGDLYMTEEDFISAIAPKNQDYVSPC
jgi:solute carrier family 25 aspartate/glutamate transporter 12/13